MNHSYKADQFPKTCRSCKGTVSLEEWVNLSFQKTQDHLDDVDLEMRVHGCGTTIGVEIPRLPRYAMDEFPVKCVTCCDHIDEPTWRGLEFVEIIKGDSIIDFEERTHSCGGPVWVLVQMKHLSMHSGCWNCISTEVHKDGLCWNCTDLANEVTS